MAPSVASARGRSQSRSQERQAGGQRRREETENENAGHSHVRSPRAVFVVVRDWFQINISAPMRNLSHSESAATICLGLHTGLFPAPGCTMLCLGGCLIFVRRLPIFRRIPSAVLSTISAAINLMLAPVQLAAIPFFIRLADRLGISGRLAFDAVAVTVDAASSGWSKAQEMMLFVMHNFSAACLAWLLTTVLVVILGFVLALVLSWVSRFPREREVRRNKA